MGTTSALGRIHQGQCSGLADDGAIASIGWTGAEHVRRVSHRDQAMSRPGRPDPSGST